MLCIKSPPFYNVVLNEPFTMVKGDFCSASISEIVRFKFLFHLARSLPHKVISFIHNRRILSKPPWIEANKSLATCSSIPFSAIPNRVLQLFRMACVSCKTAILFCLAELHSRSDCSRSFSISFALIDRMPSPNNALLFVGEQTVSLAFGSLLALSAD